MNLRPGDLVTAPGESGLESLMFRERSNQGLRVPFLRARRDSVMLVLAVVSAAGTVPQSMVLLEDCYGWMYCAHLKRVT